MCKMAARSSFATSIGWNRVLLTVIILLATSVLIPQCTAHRATGQAALLKPDMISNTTCKGEWLTAVQHATDGTLGRLPQLSEAQIAAIMAMTKAMQYQLRRPSNLLVFGLGYDSVGWHAANCDGRTVFLENYPPWMQLVTSQHPHLEVYQVDYKWDISQAEQFFHQPELIALPETITNTCWDTILVDSPMGYKRTGQPGRMESSYAALQLAQRCLDSGSSETVIIWLHDVERHTERRIMDTFFAESATLHRFGQLEGDRGTLAGFLLTRQPLVAPESSADTSGSAAAAVGNLNHSSIDYSNAGTWPHNASVEMRDSKMHMSEVQLLLFGLLFGFVGGRVASCWWRRTQAGRVVLHSY